MSFAMQEKEASPACAEALARPELTRSLGLSMATALVIGNMVGSGVFRLPASPASTGPISLLAWGFTGVGAPSPGPVAATRARSFAKAAR